MDIIKTQSFLRVMDGIDPGLSIQHLRCFLDVLGQLERTGDDHVSMSKVVDSTGYTLAAVSRSMVVLGPHMKPNKLQPGLNLIERREDPSDCRRKNLFLTVRGKNIQKQLQEL